MKTPGHCVTRKSLASSFSAANFAALRNGVVRWILVCAVLIAAIIPPSSAAPQSNSGNATSAVTAAAGGLGSGGQHAGSVRQGTLLGTLSATPSSVDFVSVPVGLTNSQTISLTNTGSASVHISRASIGGARFILSSLSTSSTIAPGQSVTFSISFRAFSATTQTATATIHSNASNSPLLIPLSGTGAASSVLLGVSPASLTFGNVTVGASSTMNVSLTNSGNVNTTIYKINVPSAAFSTSGVSAGSILAPSQTATMSVTYSPTSTTNASGSISISSGAFTPLVTIPLSGSGVQASPQSVSLSWVASSSPGVTGYYVYRGTVSGGPYSVLSSSPVPSTQYTDASVQSGNAYYYVVTSVDSSNMQSAYSTEVLATVPAQ
jgi:hypothetical protein